MTFETRCFIDVSDILALEIVCGNCRNSITYPIDSNSPIPDKCPSCGHALFSVRENDWAAVKELQTVLNIVSSRKMANVRLQVAGSKA